MGVPLQRAGSAGPQGKARARQRTGGRAPRSAGPSSPPPPQLDDLGGRGRLRADDGREPLRPFLQRLALLVLIFVQVVDADDAGRTVCKHGFLDFVLDAQGRQTGANDAAQIDAGQ
jgi:hypothetical protein